MDVHEAADRPIEAIAQSADSKINVNGADTQRDKERGVVKLTAKPYAEKLEKLQNDRKAKLHKGNNMRKKIQELMQKGDRNKRWNTLLMSLSICVKKQNIFMVL